MPFDKQRYRSIQILRKHKKEFAELCWQMKVGIVDGFQLMLEAWKEKVNVTGDSYLTKSDYATQRDFEANNNTGNLRR